jgi:arsenite methyltransferase
MGALEQRAAEEAPEAAFSYLDLQAWIGTTKHMGGLETTRELVELCHIDQDTYVLDVGCGVGATACYLARQQGCRVFGLDLRESMIARARERARKEGVADQVTFGVADARRLPFGDGLFDALLCESVITFVADKETVVSEYARVTRRGGYVGLNEEAWIRPQPPAEVAGFVRRTWDIGAKVLSPEEWVRVLREAGLQEIVERTYAFDVRRESSQIGRYRLRDFTEMLARTLSLYLRNPAFREYMKERRRPPRNLFAYLGYGVFVGRR